MQRFLHKIYLYKFLEDLVLIYPLYAVMFTEKGLEPLQLGTLFTVWSVTTFVLEIPSGAWADRYSRKHILFFGQMIRAVGYVCWLFFPNFWGFLLGFILWGVESALSSGTFEALVYDELKQLGQEKTYTRVIGRCNSMALIGLVASSFLASPAIILGYPFVLMLSSAMVCIAGLLILTLPQAQRVENTRDEAYWYTISSGLKAAIQQPKIIRLIVFLAIATALPGALDEFWTIFADEVGLPAFGLGIFLGLLCSVEALGSYFAYKLEAWPDRSLYILFLCMGLILLLAAMWYTVAALLLLMVFTTMASMIQIVFEGRLQHAITSATRATVSSFGGFMTEIGAFAVFFTFGWLAQEKDYQLSFGFFGLIVLIFGLVYVGLHFRKV